MSEMTLTERVKLALGEWMNDHSSDPARKDIVAEILSYLKPALEFHEQREAELLHRDLAHTLEIARLTQGAPDTVPYPAGGEIKGVTRG